MAFSNLAKRTVFGAIYGGVIIFSLLWNPTSFGALMVAMMAIAMSEFYDITIGKDFRFQRFTALLCAVSFFMVMLFHREFGLPYRWLALPFGLSIFITFSFVFSKKHLAVDNLAFIYAALVYIALPVSMSPMLAYSGEDYNGKLMLSLFIIIWLSDIGAYFLGSALGQKEGAKKMAPDISPKKSWWGFAGCIVSGVLCAFVLYRTGMLEFPLVHSLAVGLVVSVTCVVGDLAESLWKRHYNVKDSGNLIPGHGGMLDRIDSSLVSIPAAALYLIIFGLI